MRPSTAAASLSARAADKLLGVLLIAVSAASFGAMAIFTHYAYASGADTVGLLAVRFSLAALALTAVMRVRRIGLPPWPRVAGLAAMGGIGYAGQSFAFFTALHYAPASLVALLLYLYPMFVTVLAAVFLHERLTPAALLALVLCSVGAGLTVAARAWRAAAQPAWCWAWRRRSSTRSTSRWARA